MCEISGWIKLHKKLLDWEWYADNNVKILFLHCLLKANYADKQWQGNIIKRGSFATSINHLSIELNLSQQQIKTALMKLTSTKEIIATTTNKYTLLAVVNYDSYQNKGDDDNKQITNEQQTDNKQITTTKEIKNIRIKEDIIYTAKPQNFEMVNLYFKQKEYPILEAERFFNYYESNGWMVGKNKMKNWHSAAANWIKNYNERFNQKGTYATNNKSSYEKRLSLTSEQVNESRAEFLRELESGTISGFN